MSELLNPMVATVEREILDGAFDMNKVLLHNSINEAMEFFKKEQYKDVMIFEIFLDPDVNTKPPLPQQVMDQISNGVRQTMDEYLNKDKEN